MKNILAIVVALVAITFGAKLYLEYRYKSELDKTLKQASPFAEIVYRDLNVGFDGSIDLQGLSVTPNTGFSTFSIDSIKFSGFDLLFHFTGESRLRNGDFPDFLNIDFSNFRVPASLYEEFATKEHKECRSFGSTILYSVAGFDEIVGDANIDLNMATPNEATFTLNGSDQISNTSFTMTFNSLQANMGSVIGGAMPIQNIRYTYELDEQAASSILEHCANQFKISKEEFLSKVVSSKQFMQNSFGFYPGVKAEAATIEFLKGGKEASFVATPSDRLNMATADSLSPAQLARLLNLAVTVGETSVPISTFQSSLAERSAESEPDDDEEGSEGFKRRDLDDLLNSPDGTVQYKQRPVVSRKSKKKYDVVSISNVRNFIDKDIRVSRTKDRSAISGRLLGVEDEVLSIEIFRYGGTMKYTVPIKEVSKLEVKSK